MTNPNQTPAGQIVKVSDVKIEYAKLNAIYDQLGRTHGTLTRDGKGWIFQAGDFRKTLASHYAAARWLVGMQNHYAKLVK